MQIEIKDHPDVERKLRQHDAARATELAADLKKFDLGVTVSANSRSTPRPALPPPLPVPDVAAPPSNPKPKRGIHHER